MTKILQIHPQNPQKRLVKIVADVFSNGGLVVYPTDSGYSVGCSVYKRKAVDRLYHLKRDINKYVMAIMVHDFTSITHFAEVETTKYRYLKKYIPGHYTFILPATKEGKKLLQVKRPEVGIRMPVHPFFDELKEHLDDPILNTGARVQEDQLFSDPDEIIEVFSKKVDLIVDSGPIPVTPTEVVNYVDSEPQVVREGVHPVI